MAIKVGLCGFTIKTDRYAERYPVVEVQQTFYQVPTDAVMRAWREKMPQGFEFTIKAWQLITHSAGSPTYRRLKRELTPDERAGVGRFQDTPIVAEGWRATLHAADLLGATAILLQCPPSFGPTAPNLERLHAFLARSERPPGVRMLFEPRGPAWDAPAGVAAVTEVCAAHDLVHVVDPLVSRSITRGFAYWRLHGIGGFHHVYTDAELARVASMIRPGEETYVMFNNIPRAGDAERFKLLLDVPDPQPALPLG